MSRVPSLKQMAVKIRKHGQRHDSVLAHISPKEAKLLEAHYGKDTNPHTGLPQFGLHLFGRKKTDEYGNQRRSGLRGMVHKLGGHKIEHAARPIVKTALPIVGSLVGTALGGPMGSVLGGSLGGALSSKRHPLDHALGGALVGLGHSIISPSVAKGLNLNPDSLMARGMGMSAPTWGEQLGGLGSMLGIGQSAAESGGLSGLSGLGINQAATETANQATGMGGLMKGLGLRDAMDAALMATSITGMMKSKSKMPKESETEADVMKRISTANMPHNVYKAPKPYNRKMNRIPEGFDYLTDPNFEHFENNVIPESAYAKGGSVEGDYVKGKYGGQTDNIYTDIPGGSYVWDATTLSLLGDGNSDNGNEKVKELEEHFMKTGIHRVQPKMKMVKAAVSTGERISPPWLTTAIGGGDPNKGSDMLDKMRKNLRKQKGVKPFLPPKSKHILTYFKKG